MSNISEYFQMPRMGEQLADGVNSTYAGTDKGCLFRFLTVKVLNVKETEKAGIEVFDDVDCVEYASDTKTRHCPPIDKQLLKTHPELYSHYQKWKEGKKNDVSDIREWSSISHNELVTCMRGGFFFIEQLAEASEERLYALGSDWKEIKRKADIFVATKKAKKEGAATAEKFNSIERENLSLKEALAQMQAQVALLAQNQAQGAAPKQRGRPRKVDTSLVMADGSSLHVQG